MLTVDTHVHLLASKQAALNWTDVLDMLCTADEDSIRALCVCEHRESTHYDELIDALFNRGELPNSELVAPGQCLWDGKVMLSAGAELELADGSNVGVHTDPETLLALVPDRRTYDLASLRAAVGPQAVVVAHHMFYAGKRPPKLDGVAEHVDAVELPAKDLANHALYYEFARSHELPLVGGSDAHNYLQIGACSTLLNTAESFSTREFLRALTEGCCAPRPNPAATRLVRMSKRFRAKKQEN